MQKAENQLDQARQQLDEYQITLLQEKQKEDQMHKAADDQQSKVNEAEIMLRQRTDDESRARREYEEALRAEQDAADNLQREEDEVLRGILRYGYYSISFICGFHCINNDWLQKKQS